MSDKPEALKTADVLQAYGYTVAANDMRSLHARAESAEAERDRLRDALIRIEAWNGFPETGRYWDAPDNTRPMSYSAAFGSNGERDYMRAVARKALTDTIDAAAKGQG